jgi:hypothetical protein
MTHIKTLDLMKIKLERSIAIDALKRITEHLDFIAYDKMEINTVGFIASRALSRIENEESSIKGDQ